MRGKRTLIAGNNADLMLVSARYDRAGGELQIARGYARRGAVWTDIELYDREALVQGLESGLRVVTAQAAELAGDFEVIARVRLSPNDRTLKIEGSEATGDDLGLPVF